MAGRKERIGEQTDEQSKGGRDLSSATELCDRLRKETCDFTHMYASACLPACLLMRASTFLYVASRRSNRKLELDVQMV